LRALSGDQPEHRGQVPARQGERTGGLGIVAEGASGERYQAAGSKTGEAEMIVMWFLFIVVVCFAVSIFLLSQPW
jgi:hypothetical protein